jgi:serine/threonine-protein kinase HipA
MAHEEACYVYVQLPGTLETVPCASLRVRAVGAGAYEGTFTYGKRYLERPDVVALDPYRLPLSTRPHKFTKLKGIPGAVRDASPDAWGRRVIQAKLQRPEADIQEMEYLLNGPDDGAGNLSFDVFGLAPEEAQAWPGSASIKVVLVIRPT